MLKMLSVSAMAALAVAAALTAPTAGNAQQGYPTYGEERPGPTRSRARANDAYRPGPDQAGLGVLGGDGRAEPAPAYGSPSYGGQTAGAPSYGAPTYNAPSYGNQSYGIQPPAYSSPPAYSGAPTYSAPAYGAPPAYGAQQQQQQQYSQGYGTPPPYQAPYGAGANDAYRQPQGGYGNGGYANNGGGFGQPYSPPPAAYDEAPVQGRPYMSGGRNQPPAEYRQGNSYSMNEIKEAGHGFFGSITQGLGSVIEHAHSKKGRPNGYILGEEAGGAFIGGLRYGRGRLYTKDAGVHNVYWQGPSIGFDAGADGSKVMMLVYNLNDIREVFGRFGGVDGSAYVVGGVGMTFLSHDHVVMAPIRSGVGLRFGANIGYLKFTTQPTWNPF